MTHHDVVRTRLQSIEALMREHQYWEENAPDDSVFASTQPFFMDTLEPLAWLQWVLIPRLHQLIDSQQPLPQRLAVAAYYEIALEASHPFRDIIVAELQQLDALFEGNDA